ncbi:3-keto-disaccharide hydrolase [Calycomorphotria hydatis]|uniref:3-keto-alpha-glucoside-1,2-lyase/3-keto-2-hydroxy-glucal hydratase domain-containing protein n=1 Tax=Calycomorphotria hydatis TaxID=2528027 RepID=A0A517T9M0_9PLAN|nr:DUF1080 domain-containing protein [Calycomorphotria hydatis]QDT65067.1 hypothetical protein V22_23130 [Calycomorphotria hydatis]
MSRSFNCSIACLLLMAAFYPAMLLAEEADDTGFVPLFDGETTKGWSNPFDWGEVWVEDGAINLRADKKFFLVTDKTFSDFILEAEIMLPKEGQSNSGIMFRCHKQKNKVFGYQAECDMSGRAWAGGLYDEGRRGWLHPDKSDPEESKKKLFQAPLGEWVRYRIHCEGDHLRIYVNDKLTTDYHDDKDASGFVGIQHHGEDGQIYRFRNIRIKEL